MQLAAPLRRCRSATLGPVMMGRAAAVRANKKGKTDMIKAKLNARFGKMVVAAVKSGGADPVANTALAKILDQGKKAGVPKDNMEKAMKRGASKDQADYKESTFEAYAHGGVGFVIDVLTDNNNRAAGDIRTVINKQKLKQAESGSVAFNFDRLGAVTVITDKDEDEMTEAAVTSRLQYPSAAARTPRLKARGAGYRWRRGRRTSSHSKIQKMVQGTWYSQTPRSSLRWPTLSRRPASRFALSLYPPPPPQPPFIPLLPNARGKYRLARCTPLTAHFHGVGNRVKVCVEAQSTRGDLGARSLLELFAQASIARRARHCAAW